MKKIHIFSMALSLAVWSCTSSKKIAQPQGTKTEVSAKSSIVAQQPQMPLLTEKENIITKISLPAENTSEFSFSEISMQLKAELKTFDLSEIAVYSGKNDKFSEATLFGKTTQILAKTTITGDASTTKEAKFIWITTKTTPSPNLLNKIKVNSVDIKTNAKPILLKNIKNEAQRFGISLRTKKQDKVSCYRIPGMVTTNQGTLIAVYDNRYNNCKDLQENIDIGMSRSTDGGQTWEPMKVIMDMGKWGNLPEELNGVGDPAVLVDKQTGTIWVAALWLHGSNISQMAWWESKPGLSPQETGQLMLVKSEDDGLTWSEPINITQQVKKPEWYLFFNGPGAGISLKDGKIAFAAQYKNSNQVPYSTLIYSEDHGYTWQRHKGIKPHTTEAQIVELSDGQIMINARDDRNRDKGQLADGKNGRSIFTTNDLGQNWEEHSTSRSALIEPNCMASIISYKDKKDKHYLFFSNPANEKQRVDITIKASDDDGKTWHKLPQVKLYADSNFGYSCMSIIDDKYIGILYEGNGDLYFQKVAISEFIK